MAYGTMTESLISPQATGTAVAPAPARPVEFLNEKKDPNQIVINPSKDWWNPKNPECLFNDGFYEKGDDSDTGYLIEKQQTLAERTAEEVQGVIRLLDLQAGAEILDVPSGYGRHSIGLNKAGMNVTGLEINPFHINRARTAALLENATVKFQEGNMLELKSEKQYDALINMFYSFGFFETDQENFQVLKNFYDVLKPGGQFLMHTDVNVPTILSGRYKVDETRKLTSEGALRIIDNYNERTKRIDGAWIIETSDGKRQRDYSVRVYTQEEFVDMCRAAGFTKCISYGDWQKNPYTPDTEDMIIVATK